MKVSLLDPLKKIKFKSLSRTTLILNTLGILLLVNFIFSFLPLKIDLTENKDFTLSKVSKKIVRDLPDLVTIKVFLSEDLPARLLPIKQRIKDTLYEYERVAPSRLKVVYIDPKNNPELVNQALSLGIPQLQFSDVQNDKFSVSKGFIGMVVTFADKKSIIEVVDDNTNLEHDLTSAIKRVSEETAAKVAVTTGHGEDPGTRNSLLMQQLEKDFDVTEVNLTEKSDQSFIGGSGQTWLMINPTEKFGNRSLLVIDQFLMNGGSLVLITDPIGISNTLQPSLSNTNIGDLLQNYGVKINPDLVLSADNEIANFSTGYNTLVIPYPFWVRVPPSGPVFPWVSSLTIDKSQAGEGKITEIAKTSKRSFAQVGDLNIDPTREQNPKPEDLREITIAVLVEGKLDSATKNNSEIKKALRQGETLLEKTKEETKVAVFADSDFVNDFFIRRFEDNSTLLLNTIESLSSKTSLSDIRSKGSNLRPLKDISESTKAVVKWSNILLVPILSVLFGTVRFLRRSR